MFAEGTCTGAATVVAGFSRFCWLEVGLDFEVRIRVKLRRRSALHRGADGTNA